MTKTKLVAAAAAIVAVAAIVGSVQAHQWGGPRHHGMMQKVGMHGDWGHRGGRGHHGGKWQCGAAKYIEGRLAFVKTELKITSEQAVGRFCNGRPRQREGEAGALRGDEGKVEGREGEGRHEAAASA